LISGFDRKLEETGKCRYRNLTVRPARLWWVKKFHIGEGCGYGLLADKFSDRTDIISVREVAVVVGFARPGLAV